jgi:hypothetical protein
MNASTTCGLDPITWCARRHLPITRIWSHLNPSKSVCADVTNKKVSLKRSRHEARSGCRTLQRQWCLDRGNGRRPHVQIIAAEASPDDVRTTESAWHCPGVSSNVGAVLRLYRTDFVSGHLTASEEASTRSLITVVASHLSYHSESSLKIMSRPNVSIVRCWSSGPELPHAADDPASSG